MGRAEESCGFLGRIRSSNGGRRGWLSELASYVSRHFSLSFSYIIAKMCNILNTTILNIVYAKRVKGLIGTFILEQGYCGESGSVMGMLSKKG